MSRGNPNQGRLGEARAEVAAAEACSRMAQNGYLGPQLNMSWGSQLSANATVGLPATLHFNGFQNVPDYRIRGGLTWRF